MNKILVAGCGGASLGTEIIKSLCLAGKYKVYACDISKYAFGLYMECCEKTFLIEHGIKQYVADILNICRQHTISYIIPGGEKPLEILRENRALFENEGIHLVINSDCVIDICSNKDETFKFLSEQKYKVPMEFKENEKVIYPCIVKPAKDSGGSSFVFLAENEEDKNLYVRYLEKNNKKPIVQEYIPVDEGEYTVGVLSGVDGKIIGSICLRRVFYNKLSIMQQNENGLISSGYTQGLIEHRPDICALSEKIALSLQSTGPINIQGRMKEGEFIPFEINPRFSASTYLRSLAGFNEIDLYLQTLSGNQVKFERENIKEGYCGRSFTETFIPKGKLYYDSMD